MEAKVDATVDQHDDMPVSSDALLARLEDWGLTYRLHEHVPLRTVEEAKTVEADMAEPGVSALKINSQTIPGI